MEKTELIRNVTQKIFSAMNTRDPASLADFLAEDAAFDFPGSGRIEGKRKIIVFLKLLLRKYPRLTFTVHDVVAQEDRACAVWANQGENSAGEPYENRGVTLVQLRAGKIAFISDYFKDTSFTQGS